MTSLREYHDQGDCRWPCGYCLTDDEQLLPARPWNDDEETSE